MWYVLTFRHRTRRTSIDLRDLRTYPYQHQILPNRIYTAADISFAYSCREHC